MVTSYDSLIYEINYEIVTTSWSHQNDGSALIIKLKSWYNTHNNINLILLDPLQLQSSLHYGTIFLNSIIFGCTAVTDWFLTHNIDIPGYIAAGFQSPVDACLLSLCPSFVQINQSFVQNYHESTGKRPSSAALHDYLSYLPNMIRDTHVATLKKLISYGVSMPISSIERLFQENRPHAADHIQLELVTVLLASFPRGPSNAFLTFATLSFDSWIPSLLRSNQFHSGLYHGKLTTCWSNTSSNNCISPMTITSPRPQARPQVVSHANDPWLQLILLFGLHLHPHDHLVDSLYMDHAQSVIRLWKLCVSTANNSCTGRDAADFGTSLYASPSNTNDMRDVSSTHGGNDGDGGSDGDGSAGLDTQQLDIFSDHAYHTLLQSDKRLDINIIISLLAISLHMSRNMLSVPVVSQWVAFLMSAVIVAAVDSQLVHPQSRSMLPSDFHSLQSAIIQLRTSLSPFSLQLLDTVFIQCIAHLPLRHETNKQQQQQPQERNTDISAPKSSHLCTTQCVHQFLTIVVSIFYHQTTSASHLSHALPPSTAALCATPPDFLFDHDFQKYNYEDDDTQQHRPQPNNFSSFHSFHSESLSLQYQYEQHLEEEHDNLLHNSLSLSSVTQHHSLGMSTIYAQADAALIQSILQWQCRYHLATTMNSSLQQDGMPIFNWSDPMCLRHSSTTRILSTLYSLPVADLSLTYDGGLPIADSRYSQPQPVDSLSSPIQRLYMKITPLLRYELTLARPFLTQFVPSPPQWSFIQHLEQYPEISTDMIQILSTLRIHTNIPSQMSLFSYYLLVLVCCMHRYQALVTFLEQQKQVIVQGIHGILQPLNVHPPTSNHTCLTAYEYSHIVQLLTNTLLSMTIAIDGFYTSSCVFMDHLYSITTNIVVSCCLDPDDPRTTPTEIRHILEMVLPHPLIVLMSPNGLPTLLPGAPVGAHRVDEISDWTQDPQMGVPLSERLYSIASGWHSQSMMDQQTQSHHMLVPTALELFSQYFQWTGDHALAECLFDLAAIALANKERGDSQITGPPPANSMDEYSPTMRMERILTTLCSYAIFTQYLSSPDRIFSICLSHRNENSASVTACSNESSLFHSLEISHSIWAPNADPRSAFALLKRLLFTGNDRRVSPSSNSEIPLDSSFSRVVHILSSLGRLRTPLKIGGIPGFLRSKLNTPFSGPNPLSKKSLSLNAPNSAHMAYLRYNSAVLQNVLSHPLETVHSFSKGCLSDCLQALSGLFETYYLYSTNMFQFTTVLEMHPQSPPSSQSISSHHREISTYQPPAGAGAINIVSFLLSVLQTPRFFMNKEAMDVFLVHILRLPLQLPSVPPHVVPSTPSRAVPLLTAFLHHSAEILPFQTQCDLNHTMSSLLTTVVYGWHLGLISGEIIRDELIQCLSHPFIQAWILQSLSTSVRVKQTYRPGFLAVLVGLLLSTIRLPHDCIHAIGTSLTQSVYQLGIELEVPGGRGYPANNKTHQDVSKLLFLYEDDDQDNDADGKHAQHLHDIVMKSLQTNSTLQCVLAYCQYLSDIDNINPSSNSSWFQCYLDSYANQSLHHYFQSTRHIHPSPDMIPSDIALSEHQNLNPPAQPTGRITPLLTIDFTSFVYTLEHLEDSHLTINSDLCLILAIICQNTLQRLEQINHQDSRKLRTASERHVSELDAMHEPELDPLPSQPQIAPYLSATADCASDEDDEGTTTVSDAAPHPGEAKSNNMGFLTPLFPCIVLPHLYHADTRQLPALGTDAREIYPLLPWETGSVSPPGLFSSPMSGLGTTGTTTASTQTHKTDEDDDHTSITIWQTYYHHSMYIYKQILQMLLRFPSVRIHTQNKSRTDQQQQFQSHQDSDHSFLDWIPSETYFIALFYTLSTLITMTVPPDLHDHPEGSNRSASTIGRHLATPWPGNATPTETSSRLHSHSHHHKFHTTRIIARMNAQQSSSDGTDLDVNKRTNQSPSSHWNRTGCLSSLLRPGSGSSLRSIVSAIGAPPYKDEISSPSPHLLSHAFLHYIYILLSNASFPNSTTLSSFPVHDYLHWLLLSSTSECITSSDLFPGNPQPESSITCTEHHNPHHLDEYEPTIRTTLSFVSYTPLIYLLGAPLSPQKPTWAGSTSSPFPGIGSISSYSTDSNVHVASPMQPHRPIISIGFPKTVSSVFPLLTFKPSDDETTNTTIPRYETYDLDLLCEYVLTALCPAGLALPRIRANPNQGNNDHERDISDYLNRIYDGLIIILKYSTQLSILYHYHRALTLLLTCNQSPWNAFSVKCFETILNHALTTGWQLFQTYKSDCIQQCYVTAAHHWLSQATNHSSSRDTVAGVFPSPAHHSSIPSSKIPSASTHYPSQPMACAYAHTESFSHPSCLFSPLLLLTALFSAQHPVFGTNTDQLNTQHSIYTYQIFQLIITRLGGPVFREEFSQPSFSSMYLQPSPCPGAVKNTQASNNEMTSSCVPPPLFPRKTLMKPSVLNVVLMPSLVRSFQRYSCFSNPNCRSQSYLLGSHPSRADTVHKGMPLFSSESYSSRLLHTMSSKCSEVFRTIQASSRVFRYINPYAPLMGLISSPTLPSIQSLSPIAQLLHTAASSSSSIFSRASWTSPTSPLSPIHSLSSSSSTVSSPFEIHTSNLLIHPNSVPPTNSTQLMIRELLALGLAPFSSGDFYHGKQQLYRFPSTINSSPLLHNLYNYFLSSFQMAIYTHQMTVNGGTHDARLQADTLNQPLSLPGIPNSLSTLCYHQVLKQFSQLPLPWHPQPSSIEASSMSKTTIPEPPLTSSLSLNTSLSSFPPNLSLRSMQTAASNRNKKLEVEVNKLPEAEEMLCLLNALLPLLPHPVVYPFPELMGDIHVKHPVRPREWKHSSTRPVKLSSKSTHWLPVTPTRHREHTPAVISNVKEDTKQNQGAGVDTVMVLEGIHDNNNSHASLMVNTPSANDNGNPDGLVANQRDDEDGSASSMDVNNDVHHTDTDSNPKSSRNQVQSIHSPPSSSNGLSDHSELNDDYDDDFHDMRDVVRLLYPHQSAAETSLPPPSKIPKQLTASFKSFQSFEGLIKNSSSRFPSPKSSVAPLATTQTQTRSNSPMGDDDLLAAPQSIPHGSTGGSDPTANRSRDLQHDVHVDLGAAPSDPPIEYPEALESKRSLIHSAVTAGQYHLVKRRKQWSPPLATPTTQDHELIIPAIPNNPSHSFALAFDNTGSLLSTQHQPNYMLQMPITPQPSNAALQQPALAIPLPHDASTIMNYYHQQFSFYQLQHHHNSLPVSNYFPNTLHALLYHFDPVQRTGLRVLADAAILDTMHSSSGFGTGWSQSQTRYGCNHASQARYQGQDDDGLENDILDRQSHNDQTTLSSVMFSRHQQHIQRVSLHHTSSSWSHPHMKQTGSESCISTLTSPSETPCCIYAPESSLYHYVPHHDRGWSEASKHQIYSMGFASLEEQLQLSLATVVEKQKAFYARFISFTYGIVNSLPSFAFADKCTLYEFLTAAAPPLQFEPENDGHNHCPSRHCTSHSTSSGQSFHCPSPPINQSKTLKQFQNWAPQTPYEQHLWYSFLLQSPLSLAKLTQSTAIPSPPLIEQSDEKNASSTCVDHTASEDHHHGTPGRARGCCDTLGFHNRQKWLQSTLPALDVVQEGYMRLTLSQFIHKMSKTLSLSPISLVSWKRFDSLPNLTVTPMLLRDVQHLQFQYTAFLSLLSRPLQLSTSAINTPSVPSVPMPPYTTYSQLLPLLAPSLLQAYHPYTLPTLRYVHRLKQMKNILPTQYSHVSSVYSILAPQHQTQATYTRAVNPNQIQFPMLVNQRQQSTGVLSYSVVGSGPGQRQLTGGHMYTSHPTNPDTDSMFDPKSSVTTVVHSGTTGILWYLLESLRNPSVDEFSYLLSDCGDVDTSLTLGSLLNHQTHRASPHHKRNDQNQNHNDNDDDYQSRHMGEHTEIDDDFLSHSTLFDIGDENSDDSWRSSSQLAALLQPTTSLIHVHHTNRLCETVLMVAILRGWGEQNLLYLIELLGPQAMALHRDYFGFSVLDYLAFCHVDSFCPELTRILTAQYKTPR